MAPFFRVSAISSSAEQRAEVHEVGGEAAFHALADAAHGLVRMQRLEVRAGDAEVRDALVGGEFLVAPARGVLAAIPVGFLELPEAPPAIVDSQE